MNSRKNVKKFKTNVPFLNLKNIEKPFEFINIQNNDSLYMEHCKSKLDANFDNTDFYLLSLRHIL